MGGRIFAAALALSALAGVTAWAAPAPGEFRDCPECPAMVRVPGGTFTMGDEGALSRADEHPAHRVSVAAFAAGKFEVTRAEYAAFLAATGREQPSGCMTDADQIGRWRFYPNASWRDPGYPQTDRDPVVCVSWADAAAYAAWLSGRTGKAYRLLSEAEWEYAARAGGAGQYPWGDRAEDLCAFANGPDASGAARFPTWPAAKVVGCDDGHVFSAPAGSFRPNGFGLYDMAGNAWEWTQDCYEPLYGPQPADGSAYQGGNCSRRTLRGGSWVYAVSDLRSATRNGLPPPAIRGGDIGFRVARALP